MLPSHVGRHLLLCNLEALSGGLLGQPLQFHPLSDGVFPYHERQLTEFIRSCQRKVYVGDYREELSPRMAQDPTTTYLRERLKALKLQARMTDKEVSDHIQTYGPGFSIYQQKVSEFLSGETKNPSIELLVLMARTLGVRLSLLIEEIERDVLRSDDDSDWRWLMLGRKLRADGRAKVEGLVVSTPVVAETTTGQDLQSPVVDRGLGRRRKATSPAARKRGARQRDDG